MQITFQYFEGCRNWQTTHQRLLSAIGERDDVEVVMQPTRSPVARIRPTTARPLSSSWGP